MWIYFVGIMYRKYKAVSVVYSAHCGLILLVTVMLQYLVQNHVSEVLLQGDEPVVVVIYLIFCFPLLYNNTKIKIVQNYYFVRRFI
jgi:hypothetical protein